MKKIVAIIQARMSSTRLPGKVMMEIEGKPLLWYVVMRTRQSSLINQVVVATSTNTTDEEIVSYCNRESIDCARGSLNNVLARYYTTARKYQAEIIIRITSDCPLIDHTLINQGLQLFSTSKYDYVSNTVLRTFPRGFDFEIFNFKTLETVYKKAKEQPEREHVTTYIWRNHPTEFKTSQIMQSNNKSAFRVTVDTLEDFEVVKILIEKYQAAAKNFQEITTLLDTHPNIVNINQHIEQKHYGN